MPRKSTADLSTAPVGEREGPPPPPAELTEEQSRTWRSVVWSKPADWFGADNVPLLVSYVKHISHARLIDTAIDAFEAEWLNEDGGPERLEKLVTLRCKVSGKIESLATKMRLTQQSRYNAQKASTESKKPAAGARRPWD